MKTKFIPVLPEHEIIQSIEQLKKGDLFTFPRKSTILIYRGYCRLNKAYEYGKYYGDISESSYKKKGTKVNVNLPYEV